MDLITKGEKEQIEARLAELIAHRAVLSERIAEARALGDLSENAEYHAAREQQGLDEAEIRRLEGRLAHAQVVDDSKAKEAAVVFLGSMVKIRDVETGDEDVVKLVGEFSNDTPEDYDEVTLTSPMGEALLKARVGETIRFNAPRGVKRFEIIELS
jgi:transcription elongation factor GreA